MQKNKYRIVKEFTVVGHWYYIEKRVLFFFWRRLQGQWFSTKDCAKDYLDSLNNGEN